MLNPVLAILNSKVLKTVVPMTPGKKALPPQTFVPTTLPCLFAVDPKGIQTLFPGSYRKAGIKADLEWMKRAGVAGFQNFDAGLDTPQIVEKRLVYMTPAWKDAFRYTATLADQLGLEMAIAGSPGWSESGGPWVTPKQAMKKYVWSETRLEGGRPFSGVLPKPPTATGPSSPAPRGHELPIFALNFPKITARASCGLASNSLTPATSAHGKRISCPNCTS
jgi:hypothetical protein